MSQLVQQLYNATIRPHLPRKLGVCNGVTVRLPRLFDATDRFPEYETACIAALEKHVADGDDVVIVGGGFGVSAVKAARAAKDVDVTVFEAGDEQVELTLETAALNDASERVDVHHAVVSEAIHTWGDTTKAEVVDPAALPTADVMEIDAEGAELSILDGLDQRPRILVVESHGHLDSPTDAVRAQMETMGYDIESIEPEVAEKDVMVLTGVRD